MSRKGISIKEATHTRGRGHKQDDESWDDLLVRAFDALDTLEAADGDVARDRLDAQPEDTLTEDHIPDIGAEVERRFERVLDDRQMRR